MLEGEVKRQYEVMNNDMKEGQEYGDFDRDAARSRSVGWERFSERKGREAAIQNRALITKELLSKNRGHVSAEISRTCS